MIKSKISFTDYLSNFPAPHKKKKNADNYFCPLCGHQSLTVSNDSYGYCHCKETSGCHCDFQGDIFELYMETHPRSTLYDAVMFFAKWINIDIEKELYSPEFINHMLFYFSECRQYFAFYNLNVNDIKKEYSKNNAEYDFLKIESNQFYQVLNGKLVTFSMMIKVYTILKLHIKEEMIRKFKQDRDNKKYYYNYAKEYSNEVKSKRGIKKYYNELNKFIRRGVKKGNLKKNQACGSAGKTV